MLQERYAIEYLAIEIPRQHQGSVAVVEKFHIVDQVEHIRLQNVAQIGPRHNQKRIRYFIPLHAARQTRLYFSPRAQPEALVDTCFREIVGVVAPQYAAQTDGVRQGEDRHVFVDHIAPLLRVHPRRTGLEGE